MSSPSNSVPGPYDFKSALIGWSLAFGLTLLVLLIGILPPFVEEPLRGILMGAMEPFCHQLPDRSFHVNGVQLGICHRCLGIYSGLPIAVAGFLLFRRWNGFFSKRAKFILLISLMPLAVDWSLDFLGVWENTASSRLITGGIFGLTAGFYLALGIVNIGRPANQTTQPIRAGHTPNVDSEGSSITQEAIDSRSGSNNGDGNPSAELSPHNSQTNRI